MCLAEAPSILVLSFEWRLFFSLRLQLVWILASSIDHWQCCKGARGGINERNESTLVNLVDFRGVYVSWNKILTKLILVDLMLASINYHWLSRMSKCQLAINFLISSRSQTWTSSCKNLTTSKNNHRHVPRRH